MGYLETTKIVPGFKFLPLISFHSFIFLIETPGNVATTEVVVNNHSGNEA